MDKTENNKVAASATKDKNTAASATNNKTDHVPIPSHIDNAEIDRLRRANRNPLFNLPKNPALVPSIVYYTDYAPGDLALKEVEQSLIEATRICKARTDTLKVHSIPGLDTIAAGFESAQVLLNSELGFGFIAVVNCAPRFDNKTEERKANVGERLVFGLLPNGTSLLIVNSGHSLSFFKEWVLAGKMKFSELNVPDKGSQFRSRDYFPWAAALYARHLINKTHELGADEVTKRIASGDLKSLIKDFSLLGAEVDVNAIPDMPHGVVLYRDNFGNLKLNTPHEDIVKLYGHGKELIVTLEGAARAERGTITGGSFESKSGALSVSSGSSGWTRPDGSKPHFAELFVRGERAATWFADEKGNDAKIGQKAIACAYDDFVQAKAETVKALGYAKNSDDVRFMHAFAEAGLIDGFDSTKLKLAVAQGNIGDILKTSAALQKPKDPPIGPGLGG